MNSKMSGKGNKKFRVIDFWERQKTLAIFAAKSKEKTFVSDSIRN